jgi:hypothetical protein
MILAVSLLLLMIAAVGALGTARLILSQQSMNTRRADLTKSFYAAEAGAGLVAQWTIQPASFAPDPDLFAPGVDFSFANLTAALESGDYRVPLDALPVLESESGHKAGRVGRLELLQAGADDPLECLFKIRSTGVGPRGVQQTVVYYVNRNPLFELRAPAALVSLNAAQAGGNARIHWGEAWARHDMTMLNKSQMSHLNSSSSDFDPWVKQVGIDLRGSFWFLPGLISEPSQAFYLLPDRPAQHAGR